MAIDHVESHQSDVPFQTQFTPVGHVGIDLIPCQYHIYPCILKTPAILLELKLSTIGLVVFNYIVVFLFHCCIG
jgi:hypothetical protein